MAPILRTNPHGSTRPLADEAEPHHGAVVEAVDLSITYRRKGREIHAVSDVTLSVGKGEFVSVIGPSGCGKSTMLRAIADLLSGVEIEGALRVNGKTPEQARRDLDFALVFQSPVLLPWRSVRDNVRLPSEVVPRRKRVVRETPDELLALVGLEEFGDAYPAECSGGMQQRVSIARALSLDPSVLLMDEPFGALDEITREQMNLELLKIIRIDGPSILFITHSIEEAVYLSDRVVVMSSRPGRIKDVISIDLPRPRNPEVRRASEFQQFQNILRRSLEG